MIDDRLQSQTYYCDLPTESTSIDSIINNDLHCCTIRGNNACCKIMRIVAKQYMSMNTYIPHSPREMTECHSPFDRLQVTM